MPPHRLAARPHGLRRAAITAGLDLNGGDVRAAQRFSRHLDLPETAPGTRHAASPAGQGSGTGGGDGGRWSVV
jgi:integrase/recombinase XerC